MNFASRLNLKNNTVCVLLVCLLAVAVASSAKPIGKWIDLHITFGGIKDIWGAIRWKEDWETAKPISTSLDRTWYVSAGRPIQIAHALGESGMADANSFASLTRAVKTGFRLFEVDLWLDPAGNLRCEHDDHTAVMLQPGDCTLERLLPRIAAVNGWLVLDIKSDFESSGRKVVELLRSNGLASRVVFQLYQPAHLHLFTSWAAELPLPEPLVTTYASHRSVQYIADHAVSLGLHILALPLADVVMLKNRPKSLELLVHPVHDCESLKNAMRQGVAGFYTTARLLCDGRTKRE